MNIIERIEIQIQESLKLYEKAASQGHEIGAVEAAKAHLRMIESLKNEGKTNELHSI